VVDTTANDGSIDAVAASLIEMPVEKVKEEETVDLEQPEQDDAQDQVESEDTAAEEVDENSDEGTDEEDTEADEEAPAEQLFTVKVDGRDQQVPLNELLRGYSGQAYIQKGMKEVASARQETTAVYEALQAERQQLAQVFQAAQSGQIPMQPPSMPSEDLLSKDPIGYLEARVRYDKDLASYQNAQGLRQQLEAQDAENRMQSHRAYLAEQQQQLARAIPALAKPETAAKVKQDLINAGTQVYGFTNDELEQVADHRLLRVLHDAAQYRRIVSGKAAVEKQAQQQQRTPVIKPGARPAAQASKNVTTEKAKVQMKRTGSIDDVARFLLT
jgi:hypothetical protein